MTFIRNAWYVAAWDAEVDSAPFARTICGIEGDRVFVTRWMPGVDVPPFWRGALKREGDVDRWQICEFIAPSSVIIDVGVAPVGSGATVEHHDQGVRARQIIARLIREQNPAQEAAE